MARNIKVCSICFEVVMLEFRENDFQKLYYKSNQECISHLSSALKLFTDYFLQYHFFPLGLAFIEKNFMNKF